MLVRSRLLAHPRSRGLLGPPRGAWHVEAPRPSTRVPSPGLSLGIETAEGNQPEHEYNLYLKCQAGTAQKKVGIFNEVFNKRAQLIFT